MVAHARQGEAREILDRALRYGESTPPDVKKLAKHRHDMGRLYRQAVSDGVGFDHSLHAVVELTNQRGYAPFEELMGPKG